MFRREKSTEISATLPTPQKASGSVQKTMWFFNSNKQIIFSTSYRLWLIRRKAFYWYCIPRSISINDTTIVRNFYPPKFHPWCKSKKRYNLSMASKKTGISPTCLQKFLPSPPFPSKMNAALTLISWKFAFVAVKTWNY